MRSFNKDVLPPPPKLLKVLTFPDNLLRISSAPVPLEKKEEIQELIKLMLKTMTFYSADGLSAPQIRVHYRLFVIKNQDNDRVFINPKLIHESLEKNNALESCLSFPGVKELISRPTQIKISFQDENFDKKELEVEGLIARAILHEMDHLDGKLFIDHLSSLKREMIVKKMKKRKGLK